MKKPTLIISILLKLALLSVFTAHAEDFDSYLHLTPNKNLIENKDLSNFTVSYVGESNNISIIDFNGNFDKDVDDEPNIAARQAVTQEFYNHHDDQYDFLVFFTKFPVDSGEAAAFNITYSNDTQGIGMPIFDESLDMGSERLQASIDMTELSDWEFNPMKNQFKVTMNLLLHEMMHRWGIKAKYIDGAGQVSDLLLGRDGSHWNYFLNSKASVMYGSLWQDQGDNSFKNTKISHSFSPLDLYLMGFKSAESVPDFFLIENGTPGNREDLPSQLGTQVSGNRVDISIDDIIAAEGVRIPGVEDSQHKFSFKFILLKPFGQEINPQDIGSLVVLQREFKKRFFAETNGLGEIYYPEIGIQAEGSHPNGLEYNETNNQTVDLQSAELFLLNSYIDTESHWADKVATKYRDTSVAIEALRASGIAAIESSVNGWLRLQRSSAKNNDDLAWLLLSNSLSLSLRNDVVNELIQNMNDDGGWGFSVDSASSVMTQHWYLNLCCIFVERILHLHWIH